MDSNGNRHVPYLNVNDDKRKLNLNWFSNDWNAHYRFAAVRNSLFKTPLTYYVRGVSFANCLRQPPSIFPASVMGAEMVANFLLSIALISQVICRKYLSVSSLTLAFWTKISF